MSAKTIFCRIRCTFLFAVVISVACCNGALSQSDWPGGSSSGEPEADSGWPSGTSDTYNHEKYTSATEIQTFACTFDLARQGVVDSFFNQRGSGGKPLCPRDTSAYGNYFSGNRGDALSELIRSTGVREDRIIAVEQQGFKNAAAMLCETHDGEVKQLVIWDPAFLGELDRRAGTRWASVAVLAHELAHHHNNDTGQNHDRIPSHKRREQELFADRWAGQKLREFGTSRRDATAVFALMGEGGDTHPPSSLRVQAAGEGWDRSSTGGPGAGNPNPQPAFYCYTQLGVCQMRIAVARGTYCQCLTPTGPVTGVAQ